MSLIDKYLPDYDYNEKHSILINDHLKDCYYAAMHLDLSQSKVIWLLFRLRGLPVANPKLSDMTKDMKFTLLEENRFSEFIYGFWAKPNIEWVEDLNEFIHGDTGYEAKSVWNFSFIQKDENCCEISTETRVKCLTKRAKIIFSIYWFFIKPFSGLIRIKMLKLIKKSLAKESGAAKRTHASN